MVEVKRYVEEVEGNVFAVTEQTQDNGNVKIIKDVMSLDRIEEYLRDDKEQMQRYADQEKENNKLIKQIKIRLKKFSSERGYASYKKHYEEYEIFEKILELKIAYMLSDDYLAALEKYEHKRDTYKSFYITMSEEKQLEQLELNKEAFNDIKSEQKEFIDQMNECRKLLKNV